MITEIANVIKKSKNVIILTHTSSDGDCLGSSFALKLMLEGIGKNVSVKIEEEKPPRICTILYGVDEQKEIKPDLVIAVDCGDMERMGSRKTIFDNCSETINIDHHPTNDKYAKYNYVNKDAAATAEIIYELAQFMEIEITDEIANNIYVAIVSDTGGFAFSNTKSHTHSIAAQLLEKNVNNAFINSFLFENNSFTRLMLMREALNSFETHADGKIALVSITKNQMEKVGAINDDTGGLIDLPRSLDTAAVSFCFKETDEGIKVSMRSKYIDVASLAEKYGGGGHVRASGCTMNTDLQTAKNTIIEDAKKRILLEVRNYGRNN